MTTPSTSTTTTPTAPPEDLEWEEWDSTTSPLSFSHHCLAGSFAGVAEHTLLYPLDTVKTCWQSQVLANASGGGGAVGCSECPSTKTGGGVLNNPLLEGVASQFRQQQASMSSKSTSASLKGVNSYQNNNQQGIWSTMKHLMRQGHHHSPAPANHQFSHAHVYTLAGNPPNVVDLTTTNTATTIMADSSYSSKTKRPWSKQSRALRNATIQDITAHGMIHTSAVHGSGGSGADAAFTAASSGSVQPNNAGFKRLWRGVQTMFVGCIPAHALYFSSYEMIKSYCTDQNKGHNHVHAQQQQHHEGHVGHDTLSPMQAMLAGGVATLLHDFVMTPMDTMKQRMQLGHYDNLRHAFVSIVWGQSSNTKVMNSATGNTTTAGDATTAMLVKNAGEGWKGLYRSFPITVMTNVPYGMIMMTANEWLRGVLEDGLYGIHEQHQYEENPFHFATILLSGMGAGAIASSVTAPLDRVKTRLQTQRMGMVLPSSHHYIASTASSSTISTAAAGNNTTAGGAGSATAIMEERALAAAQGQPKICPKMAVQDVKRTLFPSSSGSTTSTGTVFRNSIQQQQQQLAKTPFKTYYTTPLEAFQSILQEEGPRGLFRGTLPRVALHAPSVAISWTAYEMAKDCFVSMQS